MGGLVKELEDQIQCNQDWLSHIDFKIKSLENDNSQLNQEWRNSFKVNTNQNQLKNLLNYRQCIIDKICNNNNYIEQLNLKLTNYHNTTSFYQRMYWFINKCIHYLY